MPKSATRTVEHVTFTDHSIPRRPRNIEPQRADARSLMSFWNAPADERDLAMAYAAIAPTQPGVRPQALALLEKAASRDPNDIAVLSQLAQFYDRMGREDEAMALCERILQADPANTAAAINLAIYRIKRGRASEAISLWKSALTRNPALTGARVNLAVAQFRTGDSAAAEATLLEALKYDPDSEAARKLLGEIKAARPSAK
jgi:tetratricopeptide (TPR) repeat protein